VYIYADLYIFTCMHVYIHAYIDINIYIYLEYVYACVCMYIYMHIYLFIYIYIHIYLFIYIYIHTYIFRISIFTCTYIHIQKMYRDQKECVSECVCVCVGASTFQNIYCSSTANHTPCAPANTVSKET
jgi:hypothetical protein